MDFVNKPKKGVSSNLKKDTSRKSVNRSCWRISCSYSPL